MTARSTTCPATTEPRLLNLGCGARSHPAWHNLDLHPQRPGVMRHDVTRPLPFPATHFDAVYHAHLLEHLPPAQAPTLLAECRRVLRPGGVLRIVVPDLEQLARLYLDAAERAWHGDAEAAAHHRWLVMEMYDQATREAPGGAMIPYLQGAPASLAWYRLGTDGALIRAHLHHAVPSARVSRWRGWLLGSWRERLLRWLLGDEYETLRMGRFRRSGEVHLWMYDRVALRALLDAAGFTAMRVVAPAESAIDRWSAYGLDSHVDGSATKPDSIHVEAIKP